MGYDQYTVANDCSCRTYFCYFPSALANIYISGLPYDSFKFLWKIVHLKSPTIPFRIVACTFSDNLSQNSCIQLFRESLSRIKCTRQSRKVIWDMINTLLLTTVAVEPTFVTFLQHSQTYISGLPYDSFKFLWKIVHLKSPTIPFRIVACTFSDNLSQNSCIQLFRESLSRIKCTRQSRKVIWDMINTLLLTTVAVEPTFVTFLQHSQTYISGLPYDSFKFLWKTVHLKSPTIPFRIVACTFSDNVSQNSCIFNNYSSSPNGLWVNSPWGRRPNGLLTQRPWGREE